MKTELFSIADIAKILNVPESTLHDYRERFSSYIPVVGMGRNRKHPYEAINIFSVISEHSRVGKKRDEIESVLQSISNKTTSGDTVDVSKLEKKIDYVYEEINAALSELRETYKAATDTRAALSLVGESKEQFTVLIQEITSMREQVSATNKTLDSVLAEVGKLSKLMLDQRDRELMGMLRSSKQRKWFAK